MPINHLLKAPDGKGVSITSRTLALTIASVVNTLLSLLLSMVAARVLTKTELAINSQTFLVYSTISPFLALGIPSGIYYHITRNEHRKRAVLNESILLLLVGCLAFSLFILFGGNKLLANAFGNPDIAQLLFLLIPYVMCVVPMSVLSCIVVYENRIRFNAIFSALQTLIILTIVTISMLIFRTGSSMVISRVAITGVFACIMTIVVYRIILNGGGAKMTPSSIKALLAISIPIGLASILSTLDVNLDKWIVSIMLSPEVYADYTQGARELPLVSSITGSITTVMLVDITKAAKAGNLNTAVSLFRKVAEKSSLLLIPLMVFFMVAASPFIRFLYTDAYIGAVPVFQTYLLYLPIRVVQYGPLLIALNKSKFILFRSIGELCLNAVLSILAVRFMGATGAALATIATVYLFDVPLNLYVISKATKVKWTKLLPYKRIVLCLLLSLPGAAACIGMRLHFTATLPPLFALAIELVLFATITCALMVWCLGLPVGKYYEACKGYVGAMFGGGENRNGR